MISDIDHVSYCLSLLEDVEFGDLSRCEGSYASCEGVQLLYFLNFGECLGDGRIF